MLRSLHRSVSWRGARLLCNIVSQQYCIKCCSSSTFTALLLKHAVVAIPLLHVRRLANESSRKSPSAATYAYEPKQFLEDVNFWSSKIGSTRSVVSRAKHAFQGLKVQQILELLHDVAKSPQENHEDIARAYSCWILSYYLIDLQNIRQLDLLSSALGGRIIREIFNVSFNPSFSAIQPSTVLSHILRNIRSELGVENRVNIAFLVLFHAHSQYLTRLRADRKPSPRLTVFDDVLFNQDWLGDLSHVGKDSIAIAADAIFGALQRQDRQFTKKSPIDAFILRVNHSLDIRMFDEKRPLISYQPFTVNQLQNNHLDTLLDTYFASEEALDRRMAFLCRAGDLGYSDYVLQYIRKTRQEGKIMLGTTVYNNAILCQALQGNHANVKELVQMMEEEFQQFHDVIDEKWRARYYLNEDYSLDEMKKRLDRKPKIGVRFITFDYYLCGISHYLKQPQQTVSKETQTNICAQIVDFLNRIAIDPPADTFESIVSVIDGFDDQELFIRCMDKYFEWLEFLKDKELSWIVGTSVEKDQDLKQIQATLQAERRQQLLEERNETNDTGLRLRKRPLELNQTKTIDILVKNLIRLRCIFETKQLIHRAAALDVPMNPGTIHAVMQKTREAQHTAFVRHTFLNLSSKFKVARQYEHAEEMIHTLFLIGRFYQGARGLKTIRESLEKKLQSIEQDPALNEDQRYRAVEVRLRFLVSVLKKMLKYLKGVENVISRDDKKFDENLANEITCLIMEIMVKHLPPDTWSFKEQKEGNLTIRKRLIATLLRFKRLSWHAEDADHVFKRLEEHISSPRLRDILDEVNGLAAEKEARERSFKKQIQHQLQHAGSENS